MTENPAASDVEWLAHVDAALARLGYSRDSLNIDMSQVDEFEWRPNGLHGDGPQAWIALHGGRRLMVEQGKAWEAWDGPAPSRCR